MRNNVSADRRAEERPCSLVTMSMQSVIAEAEAEVVVVVSRRVPLGIAIKLLMPPWLRDAMRRMARRTPEG